MKNPKTRIDELQSKINPLQQEIYAIQEKEQLSVQLPRCRKMIGWCLKSTYDNKTFAKILDFIEPKNGYQTFIMEYIYVNEQGIASVALYDQHPYLNKEWLESEVPMNGWSKISESQYEDAKANVMKEMNTQTKLRKYLSRKI